MKKILCAALTLFMLVGFTGCFSSSNDNDSTSSGYELVGDLDISSSYDNYLGYSVSIKGKLKNTSSKQFSYVSITFALFDANGNQIETAMDNMNYLQAGSVWSFDAKTLGWTQTEPKSCRIVNVTAV